MWPGFEGQPLFGEYGRPVYAATSYEEDVHVITFLIYSGDRWFVTRNEVQVFEKHMENNPDFWVRTIKNSRVGCMYFTYH